MVDLPLQDLATPFAGLGACRLTSFVPLRRDSILSLDLAEEIQLMMLTAVGANQPHPSFNAYVVEQGSASCRHNTETKQGALQLCACPCNCTNKDSIGVSAGV